MTKGFEVCVIQHGSSRANAHCCTRGRSDFKAIFVYRTFILFVQKVFAGGSCNLFPFTAAHAPLAIAYALWYHRGHSISRGNTSSPQLGGNLFLPPPALCPPFFLPLKMKEVQGFKSGCLGKRFSRSNRFTIPALYLGAGGDPSPPLLFQPGTPTYRTAGALRDEAAENRRLCRTSTRNLFEEPGESRSFSRGRLEEGG